jgi:hypothetical protein
MDHKVWPLVTKHVSHQQLTTPTSLMQKVDYFLAPPMLAYEHKDVITK